MPKTSLPSPHRRSWRSPIEATLAILTLLALLSLTAAIACSAPPDAPAEASGEPVAEPVGQPAANGAPPPASTAEPPIGAISSRGQRVPAAPPAGPGGAGTGGDAGADDGGDAGVIVAPGARFRLPASWQRETPSSSMRLAQARIDGPGGPAQMTAFFFGPGGGGGVEANLERWIGQVEATREPRREKLERGDFEITWVEVEGTIKPSTMGVGPDVPQPASRLLGAVVEGAGGPWFFKATGPTATLEAARDDFLAMLDSVEAAP